MYAVISRSDVEIALRQTHGQHLQPAIPAGTPRLQRSFGTIALAFVEKNGVTRASRVFQEGAFKARFPNVPAERPPEAVLLNIAGGMAGGDSQEITVNVEAGASATITTQACERIYRSLGDDATIAGHLRLASNAKLEWLPQPVIFFDGARLKRETRVDLSADATLLAVEAMIFGRTASGETVEYGALSDAWFIRRSGRLIHGERFDVGGAMRATLDKPLALGSNRAMATLRYVAPDAPSRLDEMRVLLADSPILAAASAWNGMMLARFLAADGYSLTRELARVLSAFRQAPLPRVWLL